MWATDEFQERVSSRKPRINKRGNGKARIGVAIGELVLDLSILEEKGLLAVEAAVLSGKCTDVPPRTAATTGIFAQDSLNAFLALGRPAWRKAREIIQHLLDANTPTLRDDVDLRSRVFHRKSDVTMQF